MPLPSEAVRFTEAIDPSDVVPFFLDLSAMIPSGQAIATVTVEPRLESALFGLEISDGTRAPSQPTATSLLFWPRIAATKKNDAVWQGKGQDVAVEITIETDANPSETIQRSALIKVMDQ